MSAKLTTVLSILASFAAVFANEGPTFTIFQAFIIVSENTPINTTVLTLEARDSDGPQELRFSIPSGSQGDQVVALQNERGDSKTGRQVDIVIKTALDRDYSPSSRTIKIQVRDSDQDNANVITQEMTMYISDVNDEPPIFTQNRYEFDVYENTPTGTVITTIEAKDPDQGAQVLYSMEPVGQAISDTYRNTFIIEQISGQLKLNTKLDASVYNYYEYRLIASDRANNTATPSILLLKIQDVQDKPPYFTNLPYSVRVMENATIGSQVIQVSALDGDKGIPNSVTYSFIGTVTNFDINATSGWITVKSSLDRDDPSVRQMGGVYALTVKAREVDNIQPEANITATTLVTVTVADINDNAPQFNSPTYEAAVQENMQTGVPITFTGPGAISFMNVSDIDQGENSHFRLHLEQNGKNYTDLAPLPSEVFSESSVLIRVQNQSALDYEMVTNITFQIVATEINTLEKRRTMATVNLHIGDMNDNAPEFTQAVYPVFNISEGAAIGDTITVLNATDKDRGKNGEITYNLRGSNNKFAINASTGHITVAGPLDRETIDDYVVTAEAGDGGGLMTFVNIDIHVTDINDKAPVFRRDEYYVTLKENSMTFLRGTPQVEAVDDDEPDTPNSEVRYAIVQASVPGLEAKFDINDTSGVITLTDSIDYESIPTSHEGRVFLQIRAYDQGDPVMESFTNVTIEVEDVNDQNPVFNQTLYTAIIPENLTAGTAFVQVFAVDGDSTSPNNDILYRIDTGAGDKFRIDFQTGAITVEIGAHLDREEKDFYILNVSATDRGAVQRSGFCIVHINITDVNDEPPVFTKSVFSMTVQENATAGMTVGCTTAQDDDLDSKLSYSIVVEATEALAESGSKVNVTETGIKNYFSMNDSTGCVKVNAQLDREAAETVILKVLVKDLNGPGQSATVSASITILDYNDNPPEFVPSGEYNITVSEGSEVNTEVVRLQTIDKDKNQGITYRMGTDPNQDFMVEISSGIVRLSKKLNREEKPTLSVTVIGGDTGLPPLSSTATINIRVQDINDNAPVFGNYMPTYTVTEAANVNTSIALINATDADSGNFGQVVYSLEVTNNDQGHLKIDRNTGQISIAKKLDREQWPSYTVYVTASDNPNDPENQRSNRTKAILINVGDINDNNPEFTNIGVDTKAMVLKTAGTGHVVFTVSAKDADVGINAKLEFSLQTDVSIAQVFTISTIGEIKVQNGSLLLDSVGDHYVNITVSDGGDPRLSTVGQLLIVVEDENLYPPVFTNPHGSQADIFTKENEEPGTVILTVTATDKDHGKNAEIQFSLEEELDYKMFRVDPTDGTLTNKVVLDRETKPTLTIKIKAQDQGTPFPRSAILTLRIHLLDVDDMPPVFPHPCEPHTIQIKEEQVHEQTTTSLDIAVDEDTNASTCYFILGGDAQVSSHFYLDRHGNLTLTQALDREALQQPVINMIVFATPDCDTTILETRAPLYPPVDCSYNRSLLWVKVQIIDINDNPPEFKQSVLSVGVTRDTGYGTAIINLLDLVTDKDETMKVDFFAKRIEFQQKPVSNEPFKVFRNGTVATNTYFSSDMSGFFNILIEARENVTDGPPMVATATLRISLINDDQRLKVVFRNSPEVVRNFQVTFAQRLQNVTGYRIVIDKIRTHENQLGEPDVNKTDMFIHGEDMKTNETIPPGELLRMIDANAEALLGLRYDYKVLEIVPTVVAAQEDNMLEAFKMALILTTVILLLLLIAIIIVFCITRQQYKRKLKAATALAYAKNVLLGSGEQIPQKYNYKGSNSDLHKLELPGTNVHAYENTNPIYLEKIMLEESGERDDDDDDSLDNNAIEAGQSDPYSEQQMSMNFYMEDNNLNKVPQSKLGTGDAILQEALHQHEFLKRNGFKNQNGKDNGKIENKYDNFEGLPTTEI